ncbi:MAG TPA: hypothetical protein VEQ66_05830 [Propionibacteriaceae bacterium]|nr:hypothetical protein [Propionibacteriaceae bacterium]
MELFTTIALTVGLFVLVAVWITAVLMIKTDTFGGTRTTTAPRVAPQTAQPVHSAPRELVNS